MLMDMESDAEDFAENFEKMMQQAVINAFVNKQFSSRLEKWYNHFADAMESDEGLSMEEMAALQDEWNEIVTDGVKQRDELAKAMGWDGSKYNQQATEEFQHPSQRTQVMLLKAGLQHCRLPRSQFEWQNKRQ